MTFSAMAIAQDYRFSRIDDEGVFTVHNGEEERTYRIVGENNEHYICEQVGR